MDNTQLPAIQIQMRHHRKTLDTRGLDRVIQDSLFAEAWIFSTVEQRKEVMISIYRIDILEVRDWVSKIMIGTLDRCNMKILRQLARYHKIKNYGRLSKEQLVGELERKGKIDGSTDINGIAKESSARLDANFGLGGHT